MLSFLNIIMTWVIFSTISPASVLSWSMVIGLPISLVRQVCNVTRFVEIWNNKAEKSLTICLEYFIGFHSTLETHLYLLLYFVELI